MPEALSTTKRKVYRLLDNLTSGSSIVGSATSENKKRPLSDLPSSAPTTSSDVLGPSQKRQRTLGASALVARNIAIKNDKARPSTDPKDLPYFSPWSQQTFLARLKTFASVSSWQSKPEPINEVHWASRGWECVGVDTVGCRGGCGKRVVVNMERPERHQKPEESEHDSIPEGTAGRTDVTNEDDDHDEHDDESFETHLAERYSHLIIEGHGKTCLWRQAGCKPDIYRLPVVRTTLWQQDLGESYRSLLPLDLSIRDLNLRSAEAVDEQDTPVPPSAKRILADLPTTILHLPSAGDDGSQTQPATSPSLDAFRIAMHGWRGTTEASTPLLICSACFQRIGLWMYQPDYRRPTYNTSTSMTDADPADSKQPQLDLIEMHREHCPWRNATSQAAAGEYAGLAARDILWRVVARYADEQRRRSRISIRHVAIESTADGADDPLSEHSDSVRASLDVDRAETERMDKERVTKLKRLKQVFGIKDRPKSVRHA